MSRNKWCIGIGMLPSKTRLGRLIRNRRLELGISQVSLAQKLNFPQEYISGLELGYKRYLNGDQTNRLAEALHLDHEKLRKYVPVKPGTVPRTKLGKLVRFYREGQGMTLKDLAMKMGVKLVRIKTVELSKRKVISYNTASRLARALGIDFQILLPFISKSRTAAKGALGELIRMRRREFGMSLGELGECIGVSKQYINIIELGQSPLNQSGKRLAKLAYALHLDVDSLKTAVPTRKLKKIKCKSRLGRFIFSKRLALNINQRMLAERAGLSEPYLSAIERGVTSTNSAVVKKIADALGCEIPAGIVHNKNSRN